MPEACRLAHDEPAAARNDARPPDFAWLTPERAKLYAIGMALVSAAVVGQALWVFAGAHNQGGDVFGEDFASFWAASRLVLAGHPADAYLPALHRLAELPVLSQHYEA